MSAETAGHYDYLVETLQRAAKEARVVGSA